MFSFRPESLTSGSEGMASDPHKRLQKYILQHVASNKKVSYIQTC